MLRYSRNNTNQIKARLYYLLFIARPALFRAINVRQVPTLIVWSNDEHCNENFITDEQNPVIEYADLIPNADRTRVY